MARHEAISEHTEKVLMDVIAYLEEEPRRLQMSTWGEILPKSTESVLVKGIGAMHKQEVPPCHTIACLAGTILLTTEVGIKYLSDRGLVKGILSYFAVSFPSNTPSLAADIAGLSDYQFRALFYFPNWNYGSGWPADFVRDYTNAETPEERVAVTKRRVLYFLENNL